MLGSLSFTGMPQGSAMGKSVYDSLSQDDLDEINNTLAAKPNVELSTLMPLFKISQGLLSPEREPEPQIPAPQLKQGGDYMQNYQNYLKQFGLLGGY